MKPDSVFSPTHNNLKVVILGQTSVGKTTFLNTLLGARVSHTSIQRSTMSAHEYIEDPLTIALDTQMHEQNTDTTDTTLSQDEAVCFYHLIPPLDTLHTILPLALVDTPGLDDGECSVAYRTFAKDILGHVARVYILMVDIHEAFNTSSSRETLQLICDIAKQHTHLPYKLLVVVNKCDGMRWNHKPEDTAFAMEDQERTDMMVQLEHVVMKTTVSHDNLQCKIVPVSLVNASVYRQLKLHPSLELPENERERIGREELGKRVWQHKSTAEKHNWFKSAFHTDDYVERMHETGFTHLCNTLNGLLNKDCIIQWMVHDAMEALDDGLDVNGTTYPIREVLRTDADSWLTDLCNQIDASLVLLHRHLPTHSAIQTYAEKARSVLKLRLCRWTEQCEEISSNTNLTHATHILTIIDTLSTNLSLSSHTRQLLFVVKQHKIAEHTQELTEDRLRTLHFAKPCVRFLPVCDFICRWNDASTCTRILKDCELELNRKPFEVPNDHEPFFMKLFVQLHRLGVDKSLLVSWMERYILFILPWKKMGTRFAVYLQTFCNDRVKTSPFLQLLVCACFGSNDNCRFSLSSTDPEKFDLTEGLEMLLFYLGLSQPVTDPTDTTGDTFYDSSDSDSCLVSVSADTNTHMVESTDEDSQTHTVEYTDGSVYKGALKEGHKHGSGIRTFSDGETYEGQWALDHMCGDGLYTYSMGDTYTGQWRDDMRHGYGVHISDNQCETYKGQWVFDKLQGRCTLEKRDTDTGEVCETLEGEWIDLVRYSDDQHSTIDRCATESDPGEHDDDDDDDDTVLDDEQEGICLDGTVMIGTLRETNRPDIDAEHSMTEHIDQKTIDAEMTFPTNATDDDVINAAKKWNTYVRTVSLRRSNISTYTSVAINALAEHCPNIQVIDLSNWKNIRDMVVLAKRCNGIQEINLSYCHLISDNTVVALAENCPNIHTINLDVCDHITDRAVVALAENCPNIHTINLSSCEHLTNKAVVALAEHCPNIHTINLQTDCRKITDVAIISFAVHCPNLRTCHLSGIGDGGLVALAKNCPNLRNIITTKGYISDATFIALAEHCPNFQNFSAYRCHGSCRRVRDRSDGGGLQRLRVRGVTVSLDFVN